MTVKQLIHKLVGIKITLSYGGALGKDTWFY